MLIGPNRPFAPSLAKTDTGGAFDGRSLAGSQSCGTTGCHEQIAQEWQPSAHRYAAMDKIFLGIQEVMAKQNGAESTRYCGGCHDPISLFSGTKNIFADEKQDANWLRQLFSPSFIVWMAEQTPEKFAFELVDGTLCCNVKGHKKSAADLDRMREATAGVARRLREETLE